MKFRRTHLHARSRHFSTTFKCAAAAALAFTLTGCRGKTPTAPTIGPPPTAVPVLVSPINGGYVQQNDPATNCRYDPFYGYGFRVTFEWTAVTATGFDSYEIQLKHPNASVAALQQQVRSTRYEYIACNLVAGDEQGWQWMVRARSADGRAGEWSAPYFLNFTNCRLTNGLRCAQQPPS